MVLLKTLQSLILMPSCYESDRGDTALVEKISYTIVSLSNHTFVVVVVQVIDIIIRRVGLICS
jgi:hypothetical protein